MQYKILVDSCVDLSNEVFGAWSNLIKRVPFFVNIDGEEYVDQGDEVTGQLNKINFIAKSIKTACPAPGDFIDALDGAKQAFIITISSRLSGSYSSAVTARDQLMEQFQGECDIQVLDSESAAAGETLVLLKLLTLLKENLSGASVAEKMEQYIEGLKTLFVLNSMDTLVANGRVRAIEGFAMKKLKICPIMGDDGHGKIELKALSRGKTRAFARLIEMIGEGQKDLRQCVLGITHVNAKERALELKQQIMERYQFQDVVIFEASGLSSVYASDGGIVLAY